MLAMQQYMLAFMFDVRGRLPLNCLEEGSKDWRPKFVQWVCKSWHEVTKCVKCGTWSYNFEWEAYLRQILLEYSNEKFDEFVNVTNNGDRVKVLNSFTEAITAIEGLYNGLREWKQSYRRLMIDDITDIEWQDFMQRFDNPRFHEVHLKESAFKDKIDMKAFLEAQADMQNSSDQLTEEQEVVLNSYFTSYLSCSQEDVQLTNSQTLQSPIGSTP